jgi:uncharacterized membrane protein YfcA
MTDRPEGEEPVTGVEETATTPVDAPAPLRPEITHAPLTATVIGLVAGCLSALLGVGGGLLMVPAMVLMLRVRQHRAHGTSLAVILPTAMAATYRYHLAGRVEWDLVVPLAIGGVFGALIGASIANAMGAGLLKRVFGVFIVVVGLLMIIIRSDYRAPAALVGTEVGNGTIGLVGLIAGILSGLLGVGGGIVMVPAIVFLLGRDQHIAQGVSLAVIIPVSISGAWIHARKGNVIAPLAFWLSVGAVVGATVVGNAVQEIREGVLRSLFGMFLVIMGVFMVSRQGKGSTPSRAPRSQE